MHAQHRNGQGTGERAASPLPLQGSTTTAKIKAMGAITETAVLQAVLFYTVYVLFVIKAAFAPFFFTFCYLCAIMMKRIEYKYSDLHIRVTAKNRS